MKKQLVYGNSKKNCREDAMYRARNLFAAAVVKVYSTMIEQNKVKKAEFLSHLKKQPQKIKGYLCKKVADIIRIVKIHFNYTIENLHEEGAITHSIECLKRHFWKDLQTI